MRFTPVLLALILSGCGFVQDLIGGSSGEEAAAAEALLISGDLPGAAAGYLAANQSDPERLDAAVGAAYAALLQDDPATADRILAAVVAEGQQGEILLRRALVALHAGDLEAVRLHGEASATPIGLLLAAEVALADGEREEAAEILQKVSGGDAGALAQEYLTLINNPDPLIAGLSEAQALWALGEEKVAVRSVEELVKNMSDDQGSRDEQLLVWAGRAATIAEIDIARSLLDAVIFSPKDQAWRKAATSAIIACAAGEDAACEEEFATLDGNAPSDGLADAKATAAMLIAKSSPDVARRLVGSQSSNAAAYALHQAGDSTAAAQAAPSGPLRSFLSGG